MQRASELQETIQVLQETERRARGLQPGMLSPGNYESLGLLVERHASLLHQFARYAIGDYLRGRREGLEGSLWVQDSDQPLVQLRKRVATAVLQQFATWDTSAQKPPAQVAAELATSIIEQEMTR